MRALMFMISFALLLFGAVLFAESGYISEFGTEFDTGTQEQEDSVVDTLNEYYNFYKNTTFIKRVLDFNNDIEFKLENGVKNYTDYKLNNHFHNLGFIYFGRWSEVWAFNLGLKAGEAINDKYKANSYWFYRFEPRLIATVNTYEFYGSLGYQLKEFDHRGEDIEGINGMQSVYGTDSITDTSLNIGANKQISENSSIKAVYSLKYLESQNDIDQTAQYKTTHNAKIGYYWKL